MTMPTWLSLSRVQWLSFWRDKASVLWIIIFPVMFLVIFGLLFRDAGAQPVHLAQSGPVPVIDRLRSEPSTSEWLQITDVEGLQAGLDSVAAGDADGLVTMAGNTVVLHVATADATKASVVSGLLSSLVDKGNIATSGVPPRYQLVVEQITDVSVSPVEAMA